MSRSKELNLGIIGEHLTIADLMMQGYDAFGTGQGMGYDVVFEYKGRLIRLQVKTTQTERKLPKHSNPVYFFQIRRAGKGAKRFHAAGDFDGYALVGLDRKVISYLWFGEANNNSISIRNRDCDYSGRHSSGVPNDKYFQDLTLERFLKNAEKNL
jgi:hypothetical protein